MRTYISVLSMAAALAISVSAQAGVIGPSQSLSGLLFDFNNQTDPSIVVGDKTFHHFTYSFTGDMPTPASVNVIPVVDVDGNFGIRFQGSFTDRPGGSASDVVLDYRVDVDPAAGMAISDAHLNGDPATSGIGRVVITETWTPINAFGIPGSPEAVIWSISPGAQIDPNTGLPLPDNSPGAFVSFLPNTYTSLLVTKDISVNAGPSVVGDITNVSLAEVSAIDQTFSQTGIPNNGATPEPMSLSLFALGAGALLFRRPRKI